MDLLLKRGMIIFIWIQQVLVVWKEEQLIFHQDLVSILLFIVVLDPILVNYMRFSPKNEGEVATYTFSFVPTHNLTELQII